ncbi:MAG: ABC transporter substrate-binding protein, partial [Paracoccus sp. (in: a-proteobacteria)]
MTIASRSKPVTRHLLCCAAIGIGLSAGAAQAQDDRAITIALNEELDLIDPCMAAQSNIGRVILQNISETLTELNPADGSLSPRLATEWQEGGNGTWTFNLREGVTFSDGTAFTAADVVHSIARTTSDQLICETGAKYFGGLDITAEAVDDHTVAITADPAQPILPLLMSTLTIVPEETPMGEYTRDPIGTGPYVLSEWNVGQNLILDRRDDYWGETPEVTRATYVFRSDDAVRAAMVQTGEADIAPLISEIDATNEATDFSYPNSETTYLRIDTMTAPLDDLRVRKALNLAVDREAFLGTLLPADTELATQIVVPTTAGTNDVLTPPAYDPDQARQLLEEARADGVPVDTEIVLVGRTGLFANVTEVMEAPTPVSALLHAGVVNAGGFLLIRFADVLVAVPGVLAVLALIGGFSALIGAAVALTQPAVKTALAWSTSAQMGFMVLQCGLALFPLALLHIVAHSLYKAHAFLASGDAVREVA